MVFKRFQGSMFHPTHFTPKSNTHHPTRHHRSPARPSSKAQATAWRSLTCVLSALSLLTACGGADNTVPNIDLIRSEERFPPLEKAFAEPRDDTIEVFILAGQSNMVGRARESGLEDDKIVPQTGAIIHVQGQVEADLAGQWRPLTAGFGRRADFFGPELTFGLTQEALRPGPRVAIIKHAVGGSDLDNNWNASGGPLYQDLQTHIAQAMEELAPLGDAHLAGVVWVQGENDAVNLGASERYKDNLTAFVAQIRQDLDSPQLPFVVALVAPSESWPHHPLVRQAQRDVASADPNVVTVESEDLPVLSGDPLHYNARGLQTLGERTAEAMAPLLPTFVPKDNRP